MRDDGLPVVFNNQDHLFEAVAALESTLRRLATEVALPPSNYSAELPITIAPPRYQIMPDGSAAFGLDLFLDVVIPAIREVGADFRRVKLCAAPDWTAGGSNNHRKDDFQQGPIHWNSAMTRVAAKGQVFLFRFANSSLTE